MQALFSSQWTFASDRKLFELLETLSKDQCGRCEGILASLASLESDLTKLETKRKQAVVDTLGELRRTEYVQICQGLDPPPSYNNLRNKQQPDFEKHVPMQVHLEEFEIDPLNDGALPFVFGTLEFANSQSAGLLEEEDLFPPSLQQESAPLVAPLAAPLVAPLAAPLVAPLAAAEEDEDDLFTFSPPPAPPPPPVRAEHNKPVTSPLLAFPKAREPPPPVPTARFNPPPAQLALGPAIPTTAAVAPKPPPPALPKRPLKVEFTNAPFEEPTPPKKNSKPLFEDDLFASQDAATPPPVLKAPSKLFDDDDDDDEDGLVYHSVRY
ncbi:hypothetical protein BASA81_003838 [Batrachochytrium salamandrivorans]|nr:hypothetical protein BASA81_003838 [Batrachochytrium salamandrivorans]